MKYSVYTYLYKKVFAAAIKEKLRHGITTKLLKQENHLRSLQDGYMKSFLP